MTDKTQAPVKHGKSHEAAPLPVVEATATTVLVEENGTPTPEQLRVIKVLVDERFLYTQSSFSVVAGKIAKVNYWTIRNQSTRDNPQKELPANFCPITGIALANVTVEMVEAIV